MPQRPEHLDQFNNVARLMAQRGKGQPVTWNRGKSGEGGSTCDVGPNVTFDNNKGTRLDLLQTLGDGYHALLESVPSRTVVQLVDGAEAQIIEVAAGV